MHFLYLITIAITKCFYYNSTMLEYYFFEVLLLSNLSVLQFILINCLYIYIFIERYVYFLCIDMGNGC